MVVGDFAVELDTVVIGAGPGGSHPRSEMGQKLRSLKENTLAVFV